MPLLGGANEQGLCAQACAGATSAVRIGAIAVTPAPGGQCPIVRLGNLFGTSVFLADCALTATNVGERPVLLLAMEAEGAFPEGGEGSWKALPLKAWHLKADGQVGALWPGKSADLPAPQAGYTGWMVVAADPARARRAGLVLTGAAALAGAALAAGGYALGAHRRARRAS